MQSHYQEFVRKQNEEPRGNSVGSIWSKRFHLKDFVASAWLCSLKAAIGEFLVKHWKPTERFLFMYLPTVHGIGVKICRGCKWASEKLCLKDNPKMLNVVKGCVLGIFATIVYGINSAVSYLSEISLTFGANEKIYTRDGWYWSRDSFEFYQQSPAQFLLFNSPVALWCSIAAVFIVAGLLFGFKRVVIAILCLIAITVLVMISFVLLVLVMLLGSIFIQWVIALIFGRK